MAVGLSRALWDYSLQNVEPIVKASLTDSEINKIQIIDSNNSIFYQTHSIRTSNLTDDASKKFKIESPIIHDGKIIGKVLVDYTLVTIYKTLNRNLYNFVMLRIFQFLLALGMLLALLHWGFLKRINRLSAQAKKLDQQVLDEPFYWESGGDPLNELGVDLEKARKSLNRLFLEVKVKNDELSTLNIDLENKVKEKTLQIIHSARMIALGEMAAGVAHEINNPLTVIMVKAKTMLTGLKSNRYSNDETAVHLQKMINMSERIDKIVKGLRSFSGNSGKEQMRIVPLLQIFTETMDLCQEKLKNNNIALKDISIPNIEIECRSVEISQVLLNLINNASDAIKDQDSKWISIRATVLNNFFLEIRVTDSGTGIQTEIANKIMQPFFTTKPVDQGTGLGLSISSGIIEEHNGRLWLDQTNLNTSFVVHIPITNLK
jgi:C4-dicarboxylate-specific signal transduction histidine kinase